MADEQVGNPAAGSTTPQESTQQPVSNPPASESTQQPASTAATGAQPETTPPPQTWPDNWREELLGDKERYGDDYDKDLKRLSEKFQSPSEIWKFAREAEKFASTRKPEIQRPGKDATEQDIADYRKAKGMPDKPADYKLEYEDGFTFSEKVKDEIDAVLEFAHQNNIEPEYAKLMARGYAEAVEDGEKALNAANEDVKLETQEALRREWGGEYEANINAINGVFVDAPKELMAQVLTAKDDNGFRIGNNPDVVKWLSRLGKQLNPTATILPPNQNNAEGISARIKHLEDMQVSEDPIKRKEFFDKHVKEYGELLMARNKNTA